MGHAPCVFRFTCPPVVPPVLSARASAGSPSLSSLGRQMLVSIGEGRQLDVSVEQYVDVYCKARRTWAIGKVSRHTSVRCAQTRWQLCSWCSPTPRLGTHSPLTPLNVHSRLNLSPPPPRRDGAVCEVEVELEDGSSVVVPTRQGYLATLGSQHNKKYHDYAKVSEPCIRSMPVYTHPLTGRSPDIATRSAPQITVMKMGAYSGMCDV